MKIKDYLLIILAILCMYLFYINYNKSNVLFDEKIYQQKENELKSKIDSLDKLLINESKNKNEFKHKMDSLESLKPKLKYVYVIKEKEIDTASVPNIINKFKDLFAEGNSN